MPSFNALSIMAAGGAGAVAGGMYGWRRASRDPQLDGEDRVATAASLAIGGVGAGIALKAIGARRIAQGTAMTAKLGLRAGRVMMAHPVKNLARSVGMKSLPKGSYSVLGMLALAGAGVVAVAAGSREVQSTTYATPDESGGANYEVQPVKDRMNLMGTAGDMVFGMNNARHG